jgi:hypothetical protein
MIKSAYVSRFLASAALAAALALPAGAAFAAASIGDFVGKTAAEMTASLEQLGYKVGEVEREDGNLEAKVVLDGKPFEIYADPRTGQIVEIEEGGEDDEKEGSLIKRLLRIGGDDDDD